MFYVLFEYYAVINKLSKINDDVLLWSRIVILAHWQNTIVISLYKIEELGVFRNFNPYDLLRNETMI